MKGIVIANGERDKRRRKKPNEIKTIQIHILENSEVCHRKTRHSNSNTTTIIHLTVNNIDNASSQSLGVICFFVQQFFYYF